MPSTSRSRVRLVAALAIVSLCAVPATAMFVRLKVHFAASFDTTGAPGNSLQAEVGQIAVIAPPTEFVVVPAQSGGGVLQIHDLGTTAEAMLVGTFKTEFKNQQLDATWAMSASQSNSPLDVRFVDDTDSGMIDAGFGGNGSIVIGGQPVMPYQPGVEYEFELTLSDPMVGPPTWNLVVIPGNGSAAATATGTLASDPVVVSAVKLVRPAGAPAGEFFLDDLKAVSSTPSFK